MVAQRLSFQKTLNHQQEQPCIRLNSLWCSFRHWRNSPYKLLPQQIAASPLFLDELHPAFCSWFRVSLQLDPLMVALL